MKNILKDEKLRKLLKAKQRLEMYSWIIPVISIISLLVVLYLTTLAITAITLSALIILILLIIAGYIFDNRITFKIHQAYSKLHNYFQDKIIPKLLAVDNPTIVFDYSKKLPLELVDNVQVFNNYLEYDSYFHYEGLIDEHHFSFDELIFNHLVNFDTTNQKVNKPKIENEINYHWYTVELDKEYPTEALYKIGSFENYDARLIRNLQNFDFDNSRVLLSDDSELELFLQDLSYSKYFITNKIMHALNDEYIIFNMNLVIYINKNLLHVIIEEEKDLIDLTHSNKIVVENLLSNYYDEQRAIKLLIKAFNN